MVVYWKVYLNTIIVLSKYLGNGRESNNDTEKSGYINAIWIFNTWYNSAEYENEILMHVSSKNIPVQSQE